MNKIIYIIGGVLVIGSLYLVLNSNENVSNPLEEKDKEVKKFSHKTYKQNHEIYEVSKNLDEIKDSTKSSQNLSKNHLKNNVEVSKKIENFIEENNLQSIKDIGDVEIFAKNPPQKNEFAPPMPPTLVKLKFKTSSEVIPLDTSLINANKKIYVVKKEDDKYREIKEIDTKKLTSFTPPSIGQN